MLRKSKTGWEFSSTAAVNDQVQFSAQFRTDHDTQVQVSGNLEVIHDGKVVQTLPLKFDTKAGIASVDIQFDPSDAKYVGTNTAKFIVKIGSSEFTKHRRDYADQVKVYGRRDPQPPPVEEPGDHTRTGPIIVPSSQDRPQGLEPAPFVVLVVTA